MATKTGRVATHHEDLLPINSNDTLTTWSCEITWKTKTIIFPSPQCLSAPKLVGWWLTLKGFFLQSFKALGPCDKLKTYFHYRNGMAMKLRRVVTCRERLQQITLHDSSNTWLRREVPWQITVIKSPIS